MARFRKLRTNSRAPTSSTKETAICRTTRMRWKEKRSRPAVIPRLPDFSASTGWDREDRSVGTRAKAMQVVITIAVVKPNTRQSRSRLSSRRLRCVLNNQRMILLKAFANKTPKTPPLVAKTQPSLSNSTIKRQRGAPSASLTATSRSRLPARTSIKLARFAQAISNTSPVIPSNNHIDASYFSRRPLTPVPPG